MTPRVASTFSIHLGHICSVSLNPDITIGVRGEIAATVAHCSCCQPAHPVCGTNSSWGRESGTGINWVHGLQGCGELHAVVLTTLWCLYVLWVDTLANQNTSKDPSAEFAITSASRS
jgi:hypothetical protein